jgi:DUF3060 family protein
MKRLAALLLAFTPAVVHADKSFTKGTTWDCAKDPVVAINHGGGSYTFKGTCKEVNVNGGGVTIKVEAVDTLNVNGGGCKVTIGTADTINVNGASNKITWKKAKSGDKPTVNVSGAENTIDQAK